ncbi:MAG: transporter [Elusimicrobiales bacterium]
MRSPYISACAFLLFCLAAVPGAGAYDWKLGTSLNYDTGKYGTSTRTDSVYLPFTATRYYTGGQVSLTVPWLRQSSSGAVTRVGGSPVRASRNVNGASGAVSGAESGIGDVLLRGTFAIKEESLHRFDLAFAGSLKFPTANEKKGLGTGEIDQGAGLEFAKKMSSNWTLLIDGYYTIIGDPEGVDYDNQVALDIGFYRQLREDLSVTAYYQTRSALVSDNADQREVNGTLVRTLPNGDQVSAGLLLGLSEGSPQLGLSAGFARRF